MCVYVCVCVRACVCVCEYTSKVSVDSDRSLGRLDGSLFIKQLHRGVGKCHIYIYIYIYIKMNKIDETKRNITFM